jgi:Cu/Ag efflux pump CusA
MRNLKIGQMVRSPVVLLSLLLALLIPFAAIGIYSLLNPQQEPQPNPDPVVKDPVPVRAPVFVEVVAQFPGAAPEEVERQVTIPLEVNLAGMPGLNYTRSKSLFGLSCLSLEFEARVDLVQARQEVINRLNILQTLPQGVIPQISPMALGSEVVRYVLHSPQDQQGHAYYTLSDLRACQDWILEREFRRLPGVADVTSLGGAVKRYEVHLDPDRLRRYALSIQQVNDALAAANANVGGDFLLQGDVRAVGLFGGGLDPLQQVLALKDFRVAAEQLRTEETRRLRAIHQLVVANVMAVPVILEDIVEGGRAGPGEVPRQQGVVVTQQPGQTKVGLAVAGRPDEESKVEGIILRRPGEEPTQVLERVLARIKELNETPQKLPPGISIDIIHKDLVADPLSSGSPLWIYGTFPAASSQNAIVESMRIVRSTLSRHPEVRIVLSQVFGEGGADGFGTNHQVECLVTFKPVQDWPAAPGHDRSRTQSEVMETIRAELKRLVVGVDWSVSSHQRDPILSAFVASPNEELVKILGPDLTELERLARQVRGALTGIPGIEDVAVCNITGRPKLEFRVDPDKCRKWGVSVTDVTNLIQMAVGGRSVTTMIEGEKRFDITLRFPAGTSILDLPVDISNNQVLPPKGLEGKPIANAPRLRLRDLASPLGPDGAPDPKGEFERVGVSVIYREQGKRCIAVTFRIGSGSRAAILTEARQRTERLIEGPHQVDWADPPVE